MARDAAHQQAQSDWYQRNREKVIAKSAAKRRRNYMWLCSQKDKPCADCGVEYHPFVMEFHHRDPSTKLDTVGNLIQKASRQRVIDEIEKCDLLCANCHRVRTYWEEGFDSLLTDSLASNVAEDAFDTASVRVSRGVDSPPCMAD